MDKDLIEKELTHPKNFYNWLLEQDPATEFCSRDECGCPLAIWLGQKVLRDRVLFGDATDIELPRWAKFIVDRVDAQPVYVPMLLALRLTEEAMERQAREDWGEITGPPWEFRD